MDTCLKSLKDQVKDERKYINLAIAAGSTNELSLFPQADFLKGLPVYNKSNFSRFHADSVCKASVSYLDPPDIYYGYHSLTYTYWPLH